jgi:hypothetical protein
MIRFRGKQVDNGKWIKGLPTRYPADATKVNAILLDDYYENDFGMVCGHVEKVDPSTVGMGVEIDGKWYFDGDHIKCLDYNGEWYETTIMWDGNAMIIDVKNRDYDYTTLLWALKDDIQEIEKIGTKWDNPELLGGQNE